MEHKGIMRIRRAEGEPQLEINLTINFDGASQEQMAEWMYADRKIALARKLRENWDVEKMVGYAEKGVTFTALEISEKVQKDPVTVLKARLARGEITKEQLLEALGM